MGELDEKLSKFRSERAKLERKEAYERTLRERFRYLQSRMAVYQMLIRTLTDVPLLGGGGVEEAPSDTSGTEDDDASLTEEPAINCNYWKYLTVFLLWASVYAFFIYIEFGAVYFCLTSLIFIYFNTRTRRKQRHEVSAYSVFNRNCEKIDGTFTAEEFDKQIRNGGVLMM